LPCHAFIHSISVVFRYHFGDAFTFILPTLLFCCSVLIHYLILPDAGGYHSPGGSTCSLPGLHTFFSLFWWNCSDAFLCSFNSVVIRYKYFHSDDEIYILIPI
jgi:hypothetical protein